MATLLWCPEVVMRARLALMLVGLLTPLGLWAQSGGSAGISSAPSALFGGRQAPSLSYAGAETPSNMFLVSVSSQTTYDDNAVATSGSRVGDVIYSLGPHFELVQTTERFTVAVDYQPYFEFYQRLTQFDRINQTLSADLSYRAGRRLTFRLRDSFLDQTGGYQPQPGTDVVPGLGSPTALNATIYPPLLSERDNNIRLDAIYQRSARTSLTVFGDYDRLDFGSTTKSPESALNTRAVIGGGEYAYRLSEHLTLGALYLFQRLNFLGNLPAGGASQATVHSVMPTVGWRASPSVTVSLFGGPQYEEFQGIQGVTSSNHGSPTFPGLASPRWNWSAGGTVTKQSERTALVLSVSRVVSNGGAWLPAVTASTVSIGLSRHLMRRWDGNCNLSYARDQYLTNASGGGRVDVKDLNVGLGHSLGDTATVRLSYDFIQQQGNGLPITGESFGRNRISLGVFYQIRKAPLGR